MNREDRNMRYVIVRPESDNEFGFDSRSEALAALRRSLAAHGPDVVSRWHLVRAPRRGGWTLVATGDALLALVRRPERRSPAAA